MPSFMQRLQHAWSAFNGRDHPPNTPTYSYNPMRSQSQRRNLRSIINAIYNRFSLDAAAVPIKHIMLDEENRYLRTVEGSSLNELFSISANPDQTPRAFLQDAYYSMLDEGVICLFPSDTEIGLWENEGSSMAIKELRAGKIVQWASDRVQVEIFDPEQGGKIRGWVPKNRVAIVENPFYQIMNQQSSAFQRLVRTLDRLDKLAEKTASGKLNMIIKLPYSTTNEKAQNRAEKRIKNIELQLEQSSLGIAYMDVNEQLTPLNRPIENNLLEQYDRYKKDLFDELGITEGILNGEANPEIMQGYQLRIIEPMVSAFVDEMKRKFLSKNARTRKHSIGYFLDPMRFVTIDKFAASVEPLLRNGVLTPNEARGKLGYMPLQTEDADMAMNRNMPQAYEQLAEEEAVPTDEEQYVPEEMTEQYVEPQDVSADYTDQTDLQ